jgi:hypothetical protein
VENRRFRYIHDLDGGKVSVAEDGLLSSPLPDCDKAPIFAKLPTLFMALKAIDPDDIRPVLEPAFVRAKPGGARSPPTVGVTGREVAKLLVFQILAFQIQVAPLVSTSHKQQPLQLKSSTLSSPRRAFIIQILNRIGP